MVLAGPGTGKTQVLTARIANILQKTDAKPETILALTFTESAAANMRERLVSMIGRDGYYVQIQTFHAFCSNVIRSFPEYFPIDRGSEPLTDLERYALFQEILDDSNLKFNLIRPLNAPYLFLKDIISRISDLKREGVTLEHFINILDRDQQQLEEWQSEIEAVEREIKDTSAKTAKKTRKKVQTSDGITKTELQKRQKDHLKNRELALVYEHYDARLRLNQRYDFDDMISLVASAFEQHDLLLRQHQENIHYFLVDEYQDTNSAQNKVVDQLASYWGDEANIFVVGDHNQAIYRFQGASVENILGFVQRYPLAKIIQLSYGYRCPQDIYDCAHQLIQENHLQIGGSRTDQSSGIEAKNSPATSQIDHESIRSQVLHGKLKHKNEACLELLGADSQVLELVQVAEKIRILLEKGIRPEDIAVLYRNNSDLSPLAEVLDKWQIRYQVEGGGNVLDNQAIQQLLNLMRVIASFGKGAEDELLYQVMLYPWLRFADGPEGQLDSLLVMKVARAAGRSKLSILDMISSGYEKFCQANLGSTVPQEDFQQLITFLDRLRAWFCLDGQETFNAWFERLIKESGFLAWLMSQSAKVDLLNNLNSLFSEIKSLNFRRHNLRLKDFLQAIDTIDKHNLKIKVEDLNAKKDAIYLSTVHQAKGREWAYVFLLHVLDGKWGNKSDKRLIRLPESILSNTQLSQKEKNEDERRLFYVGLTRVSEKVFISYPKSWIRDNRVKQTVASIFVEELRTAAGDSVRMDQSISAEESEKFLIRLLQPASERQIPVQEEEFFAQLVKNFSLSVTALNTYLRSRREFVENVLLRIPRAKPLPMIFGSAVHAALERWQKGCQMLGHYPPLTKLFSDFEESLGKEVLTNDERFKRLEYGKKILTAYYQEKSLCQPSVLYIEKFFGSGSNQTILGDIRLNGRVDRIDWLDRDKKTVCVVDYKTGSPKSQNEIEGRTASSQDTIELPDTIRGAYKRQLLFYKLLTQLDTTFPYEVTEGVFDFVEPAKTSGKLIERRFTLEDQAVEDLKELIKKVMLEIRNLEFLHY